MRHDPTPIQRALLGPASRESYKMSLPITNVEASQLPRQSCVTFAASDNIFEKLQCPICDLGTHEFALGSSAGAYEGTSAQFQKENKEKLSRAVSVMTTGRGATEKVLQDNRFWLSILMRCFE